MMKGPLWFLKQVFFSHKLGFEVFWRRGELCYDLQNVSLVNLLALYSYEIWIYFNKRLSSSFCSLPLHPCIALYHSNQ